MAPRTLDPSPWRRSGLLLGALLLAAPAQAAPPCDFEKVQAPTLYLFTVDPGADPMSAYGHDGLFVHDPEEGRDHLYSFGSYNPSERDLVRKFLEGRLQYWLGVRTLRATRSHYGQERRTVVATRLDLAPEQVRTISEALQVQALPENRKYDYHPFGANCATKTRDVLDHALGGRLSTALAAPSGHTARDELLRHSAANPVIWFFQAWGLSSMADRELSLWEWTFLPENLRMALSRVSLDGQPLVVDECLVSSGDYPPPRPTPPTWWPWLWAIGLLGAGAGWFTRRRRWLHAAWLVGNGLVLGALGLVSASAWGFDWVDAYQRNENLFQTHPASLGLLLAGALVAARRGPRMVTWICSGLAAVSLLGILLAIGRGFPQDNLGFLGLFAPPLLVAALASIQRGRP